MARILIIDDDDQLREMLRKMLERAGYEVLAASDGKVGIEIFNQNAVDLVITDIVMPEKEGIETILELRGHAAKVKIIAMSGGGRIGPGEYLKLAKRVGADQVFNKPIRREELLTAIETLLKE
jgi:DNA-binding response OmpR family regulator